MKYWRYCFIFWLSVSNLVFAQNDPSKVKYLATVGFYNVENLFDTENDPTINDEEFLPNSNHSWTIERYQTKLDRLSQVILQMNPDILGLCEIENKKVLEDLVAHPSIKIKKFSIVHFNSPDMRGVDVALLYRDKIFYPLHSESITIYDSLEPEFKTRDILYVKGVLRDLDTLHVFINHWPSRRGGNSEPKRILAAQTVRSKVDSILVQNPDAKIIITGDLNDDPRDKSVKKYLQADIKTEEPHQLLNVSYPTFKSGFGSLFYDGAFNLFDQMIVSQGLTEKKSKTFFYFPESYKIFTPEYLQQKEDPYKGAPLRTYIGTRYVGGYSDHFPVLLWLGIL